MKVVGASRSNQVSARAAYLFQCVSILVLFSCAPSVVGTWGPGWGWGGRGNWGYLPLGLTKIIARVTDP